MKLNKGKDSSAARRERVLLGWFHCSADRIIVTVTLIDSDRKGNRENGFLTQVCERDHTNPFMGLNFYCFTNFSLFFFAIIFKVCACATFIL